MQLVQIGMRAVVRDVQDFVDGHRHPVHGTVDADTLKAYLLACLITAGGYDEDDAHAPMPTPRDAGALAAVRRRTTQWRAFRRIPRARDGES